MIARDVMIPLSDCAQVSQEHSLQAAIIMLSAVRQRFRDAEFRPRFVLVTDDKYQIVGVLRHLEILRALAGAAENGGMSLKKLIAAAPKVAAKNAMIPYGAAESVAADAPVEEAIKKMLDGSFRHLLVKEGDATIGIIRLSEIFSRVRKDVGRAAQD